jgi:RNA polymerase sigma-70 factor, ECF subfamily
MADDWRPEAGAAQEPRAAARWRASQEGPVAEDIKTADFVQFYGAAARRVIRHGFALTGNITDAQDIAQEAFARAWQHWDSVRSHDSPEAWVRRVATNLATSRFRRDRTAHAAAWQLAAGEVPAISANTVALVAALRMLPERQRVVLVLHYLADLPVGQIAAELRVPVGSVKAWLSRGRSALAAAIKEDDAGGTSGRPGRASPEVTDA